MTCKRCVVQHRAHPEANHCNIVDPRIVSVCGMCHGQVTTGGHDYIMFMTWLDEHILWLYHMCVVRQSEVKASLTVPDSHSRQILLRTVSLSIAVGTQITLNIIAGHDECAADRQPHKPRATGRSDLVISSENSVARFTFGQSPLTRSHHLLNLWAQSRHSVDPPARVPFQIWQIIKYCGPLESVARRWINCHHGRTA